MDALTHLENKIGQLCDNLLDAIQTVDEMDRTIRLMAVQQELHKLRYSVREIRNAGPPDPI